MNKPMTDTATKGYGLSALPLSQADMLAFPVSRFAFRRYSAFSAAVQRTWICSVARSLAGRGGLPLPRFGLSIMGRIMTYTNNACNPSLGMI